jgi:hypothetical protein
MIHQKLAFCFLLYDTIEHEELWENFLEGHSNKYNLYSHPKMITEQTPDWIKRGKVRTIQTGWCEESLVFAYLMMVKKGLEDRTNKYFCIVSGTCIPLYAFNKVYAKVFKYPQSRLYFIPKKRATVFEGETLNPHSQWMILNRKQAKDALRLMDKRDTKAQSFLKVMRMKYKTHERQGTWYSYCMDELYLGEWFVHLYGSPKSARFLKEIKPSQPTYAEFENWDDNHPITFKRRDLSKNRDRKLKQIKSRGSIFARKFTADAVKYIHKS